MTDELQQVIELFSSLPGIGRKSAARIAFYLLQQPEENIRYFSESLSSFRHNMEYCPVCGAIKSRHKDCAFCSDPGRNRTIICVVEQPSDIFAIESSAEFRGLYHVLMGVLSPLDGIGPDELRLKELKNRLDGAVTEVIVATNPSLEGNATANYIVQLMARDGLKISRIASGLALGSQIEYADSQVISQALRARVLLES